MKEQKLRTQSEQGFSRVMQKERRCSESHTSRKRSHGEDVTGVLKKFETVRYREVCGFTFPIRKCVLLPVPNPG